MPRMTGNRYFAEAVHAYGITHVFFVPTIMLPAMAEMEDMGIRRVVTHGEKAAAYMADGYARASRRPGICLAQTDRRREPGGRAARRLHGVLARHRPDRRRRRRRRATGTSTRRSKTSRCGSRSPRRTSTSTPLERFPDLLRQAFRAATSGAPGPVHLEMSGTHAQVLEREADLTPLWEERFMQRPGVPPGARARRGAGGGCTCWPRPSGRSSSPAAA